MSIPDTRITAGTTFPLSAPAPGTFLVDPVAVGLADFLAWWVNKDLNAALAQMSPHSAEAVPTANRFAYDPAEYWTRNNKPALYVWWQSAVTSQYTLVLRQRVATYGVFYVGDEVTAPTGSEQYSGIAPMVATSLANAEDAQRHDDYGYNGAAAGTPLWKSLGIRGWRLGDFQVGRMAMRPAAASRARNATDGSVQRFFPAVQGTIMVTADIGLPIPRDPQDVMGDMTGTIRTNETGDLDNPVTILERYLPGPDGSEQP